MNPASKSWMSFNAVQWVLDNISTIEPASSGELLTLIAIASHADTNGQNSRPTNQQLADRTGLSVRVVQLHTASLMRREVITKEVDTTGLATNAYSIVGMLSVAPPVTDSTPIGDAVDSRGGVSLIASPPATDSTPPMSLVAGEGMSPIAPTYIVKDQDQNNVKPTHTNGARASTPDASLLATASLRDQLGQLAPDVGWVSFDSWWQDVWGKYPKQGRVDRSVAKEQARLISPLDWQKVYGAVGFYCLSSIVLRGKVRNAVNFFADGNWQPYEDGPVLDQPQNGAAYQPSAADQKASNMISVMDQARKQRTEIEARRNGNGQNGNGNGKGGYVNGRSEPPKQLT